MIAIAAGSESFEAARSERRPGRRSLVTWLALAAVALTFAVSGIVFTEPAPVDALSIGLIVLLPLIGLVAFNRMLFAYGALWLVAGACAVLAATFSLDIERDDDPRRRDALSLRGLVRHRRLRRQVARAPTPS